MKKFLSAGCLAAFVLFLPSRCPAVPIDVPYTLVVSTNNAAGSVVISTTNFPAASSAVNNAIATYQWCITHVVVSGNSTGAIFTMAYSTSPFTQPLTSATTDYKVSISSGMYDARWETHQPYCAPIGQTVLTLTSTVSTALLEVEGFLWKGWNP